MGIECAGSLDPPAPAHCRSRGPLRSQRGVEAGRARFPVHRTPETATLNRSAEIDAKAQARSVRTRGVGDRARVHGHVARLRRRRGSRPDDRAHSRGRRSRRNVLRHRGSVRAIHERGSRRRGARTGARAGADRDEVRHSRDSGPAADREQSSRHDPEQCRRIAEASANGCHRPLLPASRRPQRADRRRRRHREGSHPRRQGETLRDVRSRREDDPARTRRSVRDGPSERILAGGAVQKWN